MGQYETRPAFNDVADAALLIEIANGNRRSFRDLHDRYQGLLFATINKVLNEDDFLPLMVMHDLLRIANIGRHYKGKFILSPKGRKLIGDHSQLQQSLFQTFLYEYNLDNLDRLPDDNHPD